MKETSQRGRRDALITGIGLVSCLGEGPDAHWEALDAPGGFQPVVDTERFSPKHRRRCRDGVRRGLGVRDEVVFLVAAHNFKLKGVRHAVAATAVLARERPDLRLVILGKDSPGRYRRLARQLGCPSQTEFVGAVPDSVPYYAASDVYLHPTYYDPCSLVVLEALASGLPVVTTVHNGAGELLTSGREGFLLDSPTDIAGLVRSMRSLMDAGFRETCGQQARGLAERNDLERNYREIVAVYEQAIRRAPLTSRRASA